MFLLILVLVLLAMQYTAVIWTCTNTPGFTCNWVAKILPLLLTLVFMVAMYTARKSPTGFGEVLAVAMYIWLGAVFIWFSVTMLAMFIQIIAALFKLNIGFKLGPVVFVAALAITIISVITGFSAPEIKNIGLTSPKLTEDITIAQISDSHLGVGVSPKRAAKLARELKELNPDIIVFTGDIFEDTGNKTQKYIDALKDLKPKYGKYGVLGNHEYYGGVARNLSIWEQVGIIPLQNETVNAGPIAITGVNDVRTAKISSAEFTKILSGTDKAKYNLLLAHTPLYHEEAEKENIDLMLSGHTHSGQIWPFKYLSRLQFDHIYGLYETNDFKHYVTSGAFYWGPPMRFLTQNEIPLITIKHE